MDSEPAAFFMTYKYLLTVVSQLRKAIFRRNGVRNHGHRNGNLPKLLDMKEPIDLPQALHLCLKLENQNFRANHAFTNRNNTLQHRRAFQNTPPIPARRVEPKRFEGGRPPFCPQISHLPMVRTRMEVNRNFQQ